jgi:hypothetical protein
MKRFVSVGVDIQASPWGYTVELMPGTTSPLPDLAAPYDQKAAKARERAELVRRALMGHENRLPAVSFGAEGATLN